MRKRFSAFAAVICIAVCYGLARAPGLSRAELDALASRFDFKKVPLVELSQHPPYKLVRQVHPSLERISAWVSSLGAAVTMADLDGDGLANDIILVDPRTDLVTVSPAPGTGARYEPFALETSFWSNHVYDFESLAPMGSLAGDFNEDGQIDVMVYFWGRTPLLYLRQTNSPVPGSPPTVTQAGAGLDAHAFVAQELTSTGERWYSNAANQADLDGDGHVDLVLGNYFPDGARILDARASGTEIMHQSKAKALNGGHKHVFLWKEAKHGGQPAVRFEEVKSVFSDEITRGWTLAIGAADLDGDLLPELYIANDFGPDRLLHNRSTRGQLKFVLLEGVRDLTTPKSCVLGNDSFKGMGVDFGDLNGDGLLDIFVSNLATRFGLTESHFLWLSTGSTALMSQGIAPYVHGSEQLGLARSGFAFEARLADFDNDGGLEALQACGFIKGQINRWPELQALGTSNDQIVSNPRFWPNFRAGADLSGSDCNPFFVRAADGRFHDVAASLAAAEPMVTRGIAIADVDGDGRLDYVTANQWGPSYLFKNQSKTPGAFLGLRLQYPDGAPVVGATARVVLENQGKAVGQVDGGNGHSGHRSPELHFGLGNWQQTKTVAVNIKWRDRQGKVQATDVQLLPGWHRLTLEAGQATASAY